MFIEWTDIFTAAIQTLPPLHREIVIRTMEIPGKRRRLFYCEGKAFWQLDRGEFDRHRDAAFESVRIFLARHGLSSPGDLVAR